MGVTRPMRYGVIGLVGMLCTGLVWLGIVRYQADRRALTAAQVASEVSGPTSQQVALPLSDPPEKPKVLVHVVGAVAKPGVYHLEQGARVGDAVAAAGGALTDGLPDALNLAARVNDGEKIYIPTRREEPAPQPEALGATRLPVKAETPVSASGTATGKKVHLNSATEAELDAVPGITPSVAKGIVEYRTRKGPFKRIEELDNISGIGPATLAKIRAYLDL